MKGVPEQVWGALEVRLQLPLLYLEIERGVPSKEYRQSVQSGNGNIYTYILFDASTRMMSVF